MGRKRTPPDPTSQEWWAKLGRLVSKRPGGRTDAEIAYAAGLNPSRFSLILSGQVDPRVSEILGILRAVGATLGDWHRA